MTIYVFTGPTLSAEEAAAELPAVYLPPASQGDVYRIALRNPQAIGIIDGYFERVPVVWHKEILWAMAQGIHVFGSASMGALRAAELGSLGMEGVGRIYEDYRDGILEDDDEVAVAHGLAEIDFRCLSEAMVNIRATLASAEAAGLIAPSTHAALVRIAKALVYPERSYPRLLRQAIEESLPAEELRALQDWLPLGQINLKRQDALAMLRRMRVLVTPDLAPKRVEYHLAHTTFWDDLILSAGIAGDGPDNDPTMIATDAILDELRLRGVSYLDTQHRALLRHLALKEAQRLGYRGPEDAVPKKATEFCQRRGLHWQQDFDRWLEENQLSRGHFDVLMPKEFLLELVFAKQDMRQSLLDHLRVTDQFQKLWARAGEKQRRLEAAGLLHAGPADVDVSAAALFQWHLRRLGPLVPSDLRQHASVFGYSDVAALLQAILREFCYARLTANDFPAGNDPEGV